MANPLRFKRGTKAGLPTLASGEPGWCTDTKELFVGDGAANNPLATRTANTFSGTQSGTVTALTSTSGSIAVNMALTNNFSHTMTENTTLAAPSNAVAGTTGCIIFTQDAATARTLAFNAAWKPASGTTAIISTTLGSTNVMTYVVESVSGTNAIATYGWANKGIA